MIIREIVIQSTARIRVNKSVFVKVNALIFIVIVQRRNERKKGRIRDKRKRKGDEKEGRSSLFILGRGGGKRFSFANEARAWR